MTNTSASVRASNVPRLFDPLEQADFVRLEHASYVKGLLRPFKDKGELAAWGSQCEGLREGLARMAQQLVSQATAHPFSLLPVVLAQQATGAGTTFLRWRSADRSTMGVSLWEQLVAHPSTPLPLVHQLFALELQRVALNMQISLTHSLARQAFECADKMARAETAYQRRIHADKSTARQEFTR